MSGHAASKEACEAAQVDPAWRDACSALLIPLNACRRKNFFLPWRCEHERHAYEKCQYKDYVRRVKAMEQRREQNGGADE